MKQGLTEREKAWINAYFEAGGNATEATRKVYGGTPGACRVKASKKLRKLRPLLTEIGEKGLHRMEYKGITGIDFFLGDLERRIKISEKSESRIFGLAENP